MMEFNGQHSQWSK